MVLVFYPADGSAEGGTQRTVFDEVLSDFERLGARIFGVSVDGRWCHRAWADRAVRFPLLADVEPKGEVARMSAPGS